MYLPIKLFFSFIHVIVVSIIVIPALISNNIELLTVVLIFCILIKYSYYTYKLCVVTVLEDGKTYANMPQIAGWLMGGNVKNVRDMEDILINAGLLLVMSKMFLLIFMDYFKK